VVEHEQFEQLIPLYAAGALEPEEQQLFERHLQEGCQGCSTLLAEFRESMSLLPFALPPRPVPEELKSQIMEKVAPTPSPTLTSIPTPTPSSTTDSKKWERPDPEKNMVDWLNTLFPDDLTHPVVTVVLLVALSGLGIYAWSLNNELAGELQRNQQMAQGLEETTLQLALLRQQVSAQEQMVGKLREQQTSQIGDVSGVQGLLATREEELSQAKAQLAEQVKVAEALQQALTQKDAVLRLLLSPTVKAVSLKGGKTSSAVGLLLFDPINKTGLFYTFNLAKLSKGKTYQLWAIMKKPVSMGTFDLDKGQKGRMLIKSFPKFSQIRKFAVSEEPQGGRSQPTGTIRLVGQT
jgi:anti-sigma-K factor RskA